MPWTGRTALSVVTLGEPTWTLQMLLQSHWPTGGRWRVPDPLLDISHASRPAPSRRHGGRGPCLPRFGGPNLNHVPWLAVPGGAPAGPPSLSHAVGESGTRRGRKTTGEAVYGTTRVPEPSHTPRLKTGQQLLYLSVPCCQISCILYIWCLRYIGTGQRGRRRIIPHVVVMPEHFSVTDSDTWVLRYGPRKFICLFGDKIIVCVASPYKGERLSLLTARG